MADAVVRSNAEGSWQPLAPVWSLVIEGDDHGPAQATFVCKQRLPKFSEVEILIDGLTVADGWVENSETDGKLTIVTAWCWQRHLDDDPYTRAYMLSGFARAIDARAGAGVDLAYWSRAGIVLEERSLTLGLQPNTIWYAQQAAGVTYDLGEGGAGPAKVWLRQQQMALPFKTTLYLFVRAHSTRANHHPGVTGQFQDSSWQVQGTGGELWRSATFTANAFRYVTVFLYSTATYDMPKETPEYFIRFDDVRINTIGATTGTGSDGGSLTPDAAVAHIVSRAPRLTLGTNPPSAINLLGLSTDGYQTPRQMLDRINVDQWRYRVNPGRRLDRGPYPTAPGFAISGREPARLSLPETYGRVVVQYADMQGDERELVRSVASPRQRSQVISLGSNANEAQAIQVADAFLADQSQRRVEGTVRVTPGALTERQSGQQLHPSRLLLAGGDRAHLDEADDHGRMVRVAYDHSTESADVDFTEPADDLDRAMAYLETLPT